ncbi:MAG: hypothetical protein IJ544_00490 [Prevotella sp.]|nr:hypothetical protein [Prevotella sp.]
MTGGARPFDWSRKVFWLEAQGSLKAPFSQFQGHFRLVFAIHSPDNKHRYGRKVPLKRAQQGQKQDQDIFSFCEKKQTSAKYEPNICPYHTFFVPLAASTTDY